MQTPVTIWTRWYPPEKAKNGKPEKPGYWEFNHIENGHSTADTPADPFERGWSRATWRREHGHLLHRPGQSPLLQREA